MNDVLPDALASVLGKVVADARREWIKAADLIAAEARATIAELRAENLQLRAQLQGTFDTEIARLREATAAVRDGAPGERGPEGPAADPEIIRQMVDERVAQIPPPRDGMDGKSIDPAEVDAMIGERLTRAVADLPPAERGEQGPPGPAPDYGIVLERSEPLLRNLIEARWDDWTKTLPLPERGEQGPQGDPGPAGQNADMDLVARIVDERVAQLPPAKDGDHGRDGQDADPAVIERMVAEAVAKIPQPQDGAPGADADPELMRQMVAEEVARLPPAERGPAGEPGPKGADADPASIERIVAEAVAKIPQPQDGPPGKDADPALVKALVNETIAKAVAELPEPARGERGPPGEAGPTGRDGTGVAGALIDRSGALVLTLSDGTVRDLGPIVGTDGSPGERGADGKDGLSFADFELDPEYDGERTIRLKWTNGGKEHFREWRLPIIIDRGVYRPETAYEAGDAVSFGGSIWIAKSPTKEKPGEGATSWRLSVKSGRPGKDGSPGAKGDPGRPGRDWTPPGPSGGMP
jgi:hypothetical protein